jgi:hypothetical protein
MKPASLFAIGRAGLCLTLIARPAAAQQTQQAPPTAPPLQIERIESGFVIAPDARFTEVNDRFATLAGVYGGWLTDRTLLVGGGAYWLANRDDDFKMQYYGGLVRWIIAGRRALGVSAGGFVGFGDATLGRTYGDLFPSGNGQRIKDPMRFHAIRGHGDGRVPLTPDTRVRVNDDFVLAEPQLNGVWNITSWMRLDAGIGYRFIGAADVLGDELRGPSGSVAIQFGGR